MHAHWIHPSLPRTTPRVCTHTRPLQAHTSAPAELLPVRFCPAGSANPAGGAGSSMWMPGFLLPGGDLSRADCRTCSCCPPGAVMAAGLPAAGPVSVCCARQAGLGVGWGGMSRTGSFSLHHRLLPPARPDARIQAATALDDILDMLLGTYPQASSSWVCTLRKAAAAALYFLPLNPIPRNVKGHVKPSIRWMVRLPDGGGTPPPPVGHSMLPALSRINPWKRSIQGQSSMSQQPNLLRFCCSGT